MPRIHFGVGTGSLLPLMAEAGADVVGVDWRTPLSPAIPLVGDRAVQGNLDPTLVFAPTEVMTARAAAIVEAGRAAHGHIFNLGHGVIPDTDPGQLEALTEFVQSILGLADAVVCPSAASGAAASGRHGGRERRPVTRRIRRTSSQTGTPTRSTTTAKGSRAPTTVATATTVVLRPSQPAARPARKPASSSFVTGAFGSGVRSMFTVTVAIEVWSFR